MSSSYNSGRSGRPSSSRGQSSGGSRTGAQNSRSQTPRTGNSSGRGAGSPSRGSAKSASRDSGFSGGARKGAPGRPASRSGQQGAKARSGSAGQKAVPANRAFNRDRRGRELKPLDPGTLPPHTPRAGQSSSGSEEGVRLQKVLANAGVASRRACEEMIAEGRVEVNGEIVMEQGRRVNPEADVIRVDSERIQLDSDKTYMLFNKPKNVVSTMTDPEGRRAVGDFVSGKNERLFHVGRLDAETEGLLLLTNDGELANRLMHPRYNVSKTYLVQIRGPLAHGVGKQMRDGIKLEDGWQSVDSFRVIDSKPGHVLVEIVLHSGKNRIVRRLFDAVGHPVIRLLRVAVGPIKLGDQKQGTVRPLARHEVGQLLSLVGL